MRINVLLELASSGHLKNCNFWHFSKTFNFQPQLLNILGISHESAALLCLITTHNNLMLLALFHT